MKQRICILAWFMFTLVPGIVLADYVMLCTIFDNPTARVYGLTDQGDLYFSHYLEVGGNPVTITFSPNGKWGLIGSHTTTYPPTQKTIVLGVDEARNISVLGAVHNEHQRLVAISPDSRYGVHGRDLKTIKVYPDLSFFPIEGDGIVKSTDYADFSSYSRNLVVNSYFSEVSEFTLTPDGRTTPTGVILDISPSSGNQDLEISPDGKTCIVLSIDYYMITVIRILEQGGMELVQQIHPPDSLNAQEVDFTPDSRYAIISFLNLDHMKSYRIGRDSRLTEVDSIMMDPTGQGEDMAVTPDGKYAVTRSLVNNVSLFYVVRIHEDGTLEYLPEKSCYDYGHVSAMAFVPPRITAVDGVWSMYE